MFQVGKIYKTTYTTNRDDGFNESETSHKIKIIKRTKKYIHFRYLHSSGSCPHLLKLFPFSHHLERKYIYIDDEEREYIELFHKCFIDSSSSIKS